MRMRLRRGSDEVGLATREDTRYCVLCETLMIFERLDPEDADDAVTEWICVTCGSAVLVNPPLQGPADEQTA